MADDDSNNTSPDQPEPSQPGPSEPPATPGTRDVRMPGGARRVVLSDRSIAIGTLVPKTSEFAVVDESRNVMGDGDFTSSRAVPVDDAQLMVRAAPVDAGEHIGLSCSFLPLVDRPFGSVTLMADLSGRSPRCSKHDSHWPVEVRHRREGQVCRWTSPVTLPRSSPDGGGDQRDHPANCMLTDDRCHDARATPLRSRACGLRERRRSPAVRPTVPEPRGSARTRSSPRRLRW
jgi:hypothetical protein